MRKPALLIPKLCINKDFAIKRLLLFERLERFSIAFTANGRSDHVTMFTPCLPLTVCRFYMKVDSFALAINTRIILHNSCILIYFEET